MSDTSSNSANSTKPVSKFSREEINEFIEKNWDAYMEDLRSLVAIDSVEDMKTAGPGAPFGKGPKEALDKSLEIAAKLGFETKDEEGYVGLCDYAPKEAAGTPADNGVPVDPETTIAIMGHVDIVPVGQGWDTNPFEVIEQKGYLFGRGVIDDKGPFLASLYAGKFFIERGINLPYLLRYIVGSNEETNMGDATYYAEHHPQPTFLLTPDGDFPVSAGEKGIFSLQFVAKGIAGKKLEKIEAGTASNVIPKISVAYVKADMEDLPSHRDIEIEDLGDGRAKITATGIPGHAAFPEKALSPSRLLFDYLHANHLYDEDQKDFIHLGRRIQESAYGEPLGIDASDDVFEPLTIVGGLLYQDGDDLVQDVNIRFPKSTSPQKIQEQLQKIADKYHMELVPGDPADVYYIGADSDPVQALHACFTEFSGEEVPIGTMAGGTYARDFDRGVAFGPSTPWKRFPSFVGDEHSTNEGVPIERLKFVMGIYIDAIQRLMDLTY